VAIQSLREAAKFIYYPIEGLGSTMPRTFLIPNIHRWFPGSISKFIFAMAFEWR
jgi:hypothetical protein